MSWDILLNYSGLASSFPTSFLADLLQKMDHSDTLVDLWELIDIWSESFPYICVRELICCIKCFDATNVQCCSMCYIVSILV